MTSRLLRGKAALVVGVTNKRSIAWSVANAWHQAGAKVIIGIQSDRHRSSVESLVKQWKQETTTLWSDDENGEEISEGKGDAVEPVILTCDVSRDEDIEQLAKDVQSHSSGKLDAFLHSVAFAPTEAMKAPFLQTSRESFRIAHDVSAYSLLALSRAMNPLMKENGGSIMSLTYHGSQKVFPAYRVMGPAKACLEATARQLAWELGSDQIRVNCISAGPINTLAARGIPGFLDMLKHNQAASPLQRNVQPEEVADLAVFLASDASKAITGQTLYVDGGYSAMGFVGETQA